MSIQIPIRGMWIASALFTATFAFLTLDPSLVRGQTDSIRFHCGTLVDPNPTYLYAPDPHFDHVTGEFKVYSCGGVFGDHIVLKRTRFFNAFANASWESVLKPSGRRGTFDRNHTCDPAVFEHEGKYYLAYGGIEDSLHPCDQVTRIGMAVSHDRGRTFQRLFGGAPIIKESKFHDGRPMRGIYGIGQPAVAKGPDGYFYMIYSEIFAPLSAQCASLPWAHNPDANRHLEPKLHLIRCAVPSFQTDLQEHVRTFAGHQFGGVSLGLAFNRGRQQLEVIVNGTLSETQARVRVVHLTLDGQIVSDTSNPSDHATVYTPGQGYGFGEGVGVITNSAGDIIPWSEGVGANRRMHLNFMGATFGPSRYGDHNRHITGPLTHARFTEKRGGTLTDFSRVGEQALIGDLDGDGKADRIVVDPLTFLWSWKLSSENFATRHMVQWGLPGLDTPIVVRDWNRDGKDELAVFRMGIWYILYSGEWPTANYAVVNWGLPGDKPFSADTNGDGHAELIVWRPSNGYWFINKRGSWPAVTYEAVQFGLNGDFPFVQDIDRNGRDDLIVWRVSSSRAYVRRR